MLCQDPRQSVSRVVNRAVAFVVVVGIVFERLDTPFLNTWALLPPFEMISSLIT